MPETSRVEIAQAVASSVWRRALGLWSHPKCERVLYGGWLMLLVIVVRLDLRSRIGLPLFIGLMILHVLQARRRRAGAAPQHPDEKGGP